MGKNSKRNRNQQQNNANIKVAPQQEEKIVATQVTKDNLSSSNSKEEFEKIKQQLLKQAEDELKIVEAMKAQEENELEEIKRNIETENATLAKIREVKEPLENEKKEQEKKVKELKEQLAEIEGAKRETEEEARTILAKAGADKLKILQEADEKAKKENREFLEKLDKQRIEIKEQEGKLDVLKKELSKKESELEKEYNKKNEELDGEKETLQDRLNGIEGELSKKEIELKKEYDKKDEELDGEKEALQDKLDGMEREFAKKERELEKEFRKRAEELEYDKEALEERKAHLEKRYSEASPEKLKTLEFSLSDVEKERDLLKRNYHEQTEKYHQAQLALDDIKTDSGGSIKNLLLEHEQFKKRNEELERIHEKYPNEEMIEELEKAKAEGETLKAKNEELEKERNVYKDETLAHRSALRELENIKRRADATTTLNDHLLKELESHKTALESRTGDSCPALTKVDSEVEDKEFSDDLEKRNKIASLPNLEDIVKHIKNYAGSREEEKQLYYKDNDIRAFLAGMAVSRLIILQGMSGTGKSSLPRIFSEAISGFNRLIPVESSWRDRNELLGYYNDFNKKFNAKSFTIELYRSGKEQCRKVPTFLVLDEMNLSRIEYYFSDFLAVLQDTTKENWKIELYPDDMRTIPMDISIEEKDTMRQERPDISAIWEQIERSRIGESDSSISDEEKSRLAEYLKERNLLTGAKDLEDGRKIRVYENVWFVGTANRDESTFEITDKVYDRAQVISLDEKGVKESYDKDVKQKKIDIGDLLKLFETAKDNFDKGSVNDVENRLKKLDESLIKDFDVSFGNRIVRQTIDFVAVFVAAGGELADALDYQISTKILRKVISSDNKDALEKFEIFADEENFQKTKGLISKRLKNLV